MFNTDDLMNIAPSSASFRNLTTLNVGYCKSMINLATASTSKTMVHLMELKVVHCEMIEEIVSTDGDSTEHDHVIIFNKLKRLELNNLPKLNSFCSNNYTFNFPLLEQVTVNRCGRMKIFCSGGLTTPKLRGILFQDEQQWEGNLNDTIASQLREWVGGHLEEGRGFQNVESLEVVKDAFCSKAILANQMHLLNKLRKITVRACESVQVIFDLEGLSAEDGHAWLLPQLNELHLINLPILSQLCNKAPRGILDFNKLKVLKIKNCTRLEYVFTCSMASCIFNLQEIHLKNCEMLEAIIKEEEAKDSGTSDLEFPSMNKISIRECPSFKSFISRLTREHKQGMEDPGIHFCQKVFPNLKALSLDIKSILSILPTSFFPEVEELMLRYSSAITKSDLLHMLSRSPKLDQLMVRDSSLQELFKFGALDNDLEEVTTLPQIRTLDLINLDGLKRIWWPNSQQHASLFQSLQTLYVTCCGNLINLASGSTSFQNLTTLQVFECNQLVNLITSSVAKSMVQLETLTIRSCKMLVEIVADRNDGTSEEIVFTKVMKLELADLQSLRSFSLGHSTFEFPCLEKVLLRNCPNMTVFCPGNISTPVLEYLWMHTATLNKYTRKWSAFKV
ncbi:uncharacterized protein [Euphorbia lathyris]|uniref:uncharacterized protein isoform X1 n=1 Tax=Euphorbia lathyris TaxID=212925 RepID=UPI0033138514